MKYKATAKVIFGFLNIDIFILFVCVLSMGNLVNAMEVSTNVDNKQSNDMKWNISYKDLADLSDQIDKAKDKNYTFDAKKIEKPYHRYTEQNVGTSSPDLEIYHYGDSNIYVAIKRGNDINHILHSFDLVDIPILLVNTGRTNQRMYQLYINQKLTLNNDLRVNGKGPINAFTLIDSCTIFGTKKVILTQLQKTVQELKINTIYAVETLADPLKQASLYLLYQDKPCQLTCSTITIQHNIERGCLSEIKTHTINLGQEHEIETKHIIQNVLSILLKSNNRIIGVHSLDGQNNHEFSLFCHPDKSDKPVRWCTINNASLKSITAHFFYAYYLGKLYNDELSQNQMAEIKSTNLKIANIQPTVCKNNNEECINVLLLCAIYDASNKCLSMPVPGQHYSSKIQIPIHLRFAIGNDDIMASAFTLLNAGNELGTWNAQLKESSQIVYEKSNITINKGYMLSLNEINDNNAINNDLKIIALPMMIRKLESGLIECMLKDIKSPPHDDAPVVHLRLPMFGNATIEEVDEKSTSPLLPTLPKSDQDHQQSVDDFLSDIAPKQVEQGIANVDYLKKRIEELDQNIERITDLVAKYNKMPSDMQNMQKHLEELKKLSEITQQSINDLKKNAQDLTEKAINSEKGLIHQSFATLNDDIKKQSDKILEEGKKLANNLEIEVKNSFADLQANLTKLEQQLAKLQDGTDAVDPKAVGEALQKYQNEMGGIIKQFQKNIEDLNGQIKDVQDLTIGNGKRFETIEKAGRSALEAITKIEKDIKDGLTQMQTLNTTINKSTGYVTWRTLFIAMFATMILNGLINVYFFSGHVAVH